MSNTGYDASSRVNSFAGPFGHALTFGFDASGRVQNLTDPVGNVIQYGYTGSNVSRVDYPDGTAKIYHYEDPKYPDFLTGISYEDANGMETRYASYGYDLSGRANLTQHADTGAGGPQEKYTLSYSSNYARVTDAAGTIEDMTFAENLNVKNLTQKKNLTDNKTLTQTFDANNNRTCRKDEEGRVTKWSYNTANQKISMTEGLTGTCPTGTVTPETRTTTYEYLSPTLDLPRFIRRPSIASGQTYETEIVYGDTRFPNLPTQIIQRGFTPAGSPVSRTLTMGYNAFGEVNLINGPRAPSDPGMNGLDDLTSMEYYECTTGGPCGQLKKTTNALGHVTTYDSYYADGRLQQMADPNGLKTIYTYDPRGRVKTVTQTGLDNRAAIWQYNYTPWGEVSQSTDPAGVVLDYTYDAAHYLRTVTDGAGNQISYGYDLKGNRTSEAYVNADGTTAKQATFAFDIRNHLLKRDEAGNITQLVMDAVGNLTKEVAPNQYPATTPATTNQYDYLNRLTQTIDRLNGAANYVYDPNDRVKSVTAPNSAGTSYEYDDLGNLLKETSPDRGTTTSVYDAAGNAVSRTDGRPVTTSLTYDALNRLVTEDYPGTSDDRSYVYDACANGKGRLCQATDGAGPTDFGYDSLGALAQTVRTQGGVQYTTTYAHGLDGRLDSLTYPSGRTVSLNRDARRQVASITTTVDSDPVAIVSNLLLNGSPVTLVSNRVYNADGTLRSQSFGNGLTESRIHDLAGRLKTQSIGGIESRSYDYDKNGNLTTRVNGGINATESYDTLDRLTTDNDGSAETYTYDANGNRKTRNSATYTYTPNTNRLTAISGTSLSYDGAGNILTSGAQGFTYTGANELATATSPTGSTGGSYLYDFLHRRVQKTTSLGITLYHYDDQNRLIEETQTNGNLIRDYVWDDAIPIAQIDRNLTTGIETLTWLHTDHEGTPRLATDATPRIVWRFEGNAFGDTLPSEDPDGDGSLTRIHLRYPGQYYDAETGLHYNWNRYYDPHIGRYITSDPIGLQGGLNTYAYVENNPLRWIDPEGLQTCKGKWRIYKWVPAGIQFGAPTTERNGVLPRIRNFPAWSCTCYWFCDQCEGTWAWSGNYLSLPSTSGRVFYDGTPGSNGSGTAGSGSACLCRKPGPEEKCCSGNNK